MLQKSYDGKNALYIVPTPIGNLKDITKRAIEVLEMVDYIFAEDTRTSGILLSHLGIKKSLVPCHKFNEDTAKNKALELLKDGKNIAIITDQGTPLISDPGYLTVKEISDNGFNVIALPGATAFVPALNMSGIDSEKFIFYGFLNSKTSKSENELEDLKDLKYTLIFYEAPHRLEKTLESMLKILGNRCISISREITKLHEEVYRGPLEGAWEMLKNAKGEFVLVVEGNKEINEINIDELIEEIKFLVKSGMSETNAIKYIAQKNNLSKNALYNSYHGGEK